MFVVNTLIIKRPTIGLGNILVNVYLVQVSREIYFSMQLTQTVEKWVFCQCLLTEANVFLSNSTQAFTMQP